MSKDRFVELYSAEWCPYCRALEKKLDSRGVQYVYKDVDEPGVREEMNKRTDNNQTIPVLFVNGQYKVNPNEADLKELFNE
jgi:glutaredoxin